MRAAAECNVPLVKLRACLPPPSPVTHVACAAGLPLELHSKRANKRLARLEDIDPLLVVPRVCLT